MRSFRSAIEAGCDLIECDVHLTSDGRLVVIHDHTLERTTNGHGFIRDHTAAQLRKLDGGEGEHIPFRVLSQISNGPTQRRIAAKHDKLARAAYTAFERNTRNRTGATNH